MKGSGLKVRLVFLGLVICSFGLFITNSNTFALVKETKESGQGEQIFSFTNKVGDNDSSLEGLKAPEYAPGELIVKLKADKTLNNLQELNTKYQVTQTDKVFKDTPDPQATLNQLKAKLAKLGTAEHDKWFWQLDKDSQEYKDYTARIEKEKQGLQDQIQAQEKLLTKLEQRQKRAPEGITPPNLEHIYLLKTDQDTNIPQMAQDYAANPAVEYAEPNYIAKIQMLPNDPYYSSSNSWGQGYDDLWGLKKIQAEQAWDISQGEGVVVAVVDAGIDYNHEDIAENIWINSGEIPNNGIDDDLNGYIDDVRGYDFAYGDNNPMDGDGHGTHVSGTIAAVGNNNIGVIGVAPKAKVMALKAFDDYGAGTDTSFANCLKYAADMGADVLSNSWVVPVTSQIIEDAVNYAYVKGCVVVAAAGNGNNDVNNYIPASLSNVIAVAATDYNDVRGGFSSYGVKIDVTAPGVEILSLRAEGVPAWIINEKYAVGGGTSMACPHVAGVAALVISRFPSFSNQEVEVVIKGTTDDIYAINPDYEGLLGTGRVNAYRALSSPLHINMGLDSPQGDMFLRGIIGITGDASGQDFQNYELSYWPKDSPQETEVIISSNIPVTDGILGYWNTDSLADGGYTLRLKVNASNPDWSRKQEINVTVDNYNEPPAIKPLGNKGALLGKNLEFTVVATDPDDPTTPNGQLTFEASGLPSGASLDQQNGLFNWRPDLTDSGSKKVTFKVTDGGGLSQEEKINIYLYEINEVQITIPPSSGGGFGETTYLYPSIYADKVVWADSRNGNSDIYMYDLSTQTEEQITRDPSRQFYPRIYQDKIVWLDSRNGDYDLYMYDLSSAQERRIITTGAVIGYPVIYADKIVWQDSRKGRDFSYREIYLYDLSTNTERAITNDKQYQGTPAIYKDKIVYVEDKLVDKNTDIYLFDLSTNVRTQITTNPGSQISPAIYNDKIVYQDLTNMPVSGWGWEIYMYDLSTKTERKINYIAGMLTPKSALSLYQDRIVYDVDLGPFSSYIYMYDFSINAEVPIASIASGSVGIHPGIYQNRIIWEDRIYGNQYIYVATIIEKFSRVNNFPYFTSIGNKTINEGNLLNFTVSATDPEGDNLLYEAWEYRQDYDVNADAHLNYLDQKTLSSRIGQVVNSSDPESVRCDLNKDGQINLSDLIILNGNYGHLPSGASFDKTTRIFNWTPTYEQAGGYKISFSVYDLDAAAKRKGGVDAETITITVNNLDIAPPTIPGKPYLSGGTSPNNTGTFSITWTPSTDTDSGLKGYEVFYNNIFNRGVVTTNTFTETNLAEGSYKYRVFAIDNAGNISTPSLESDPIIVDKTPPTIPGTPYLSSGTNPNNTGTFSITWTAATDSKTGIANYNVYRNGLKVTQVTANSYSEANLSPGSYTYKIEAVDNAGNKSALSSASAAIVVDKTKPIGSIKINNNAVYTKSTFVTLTFSAVDTGGSGIDKMTLSNDKITWSSPTNYATTQPSWPIPTGNGTKTVYAKFSDKAGNWSSVYSDTIILDTILPTITSILDSPDPFDPEAGQYTKVFYTLGDNLSTTCYIYVYIYNSAGSLVKTLGKYAQFLGINSVTWNGKNSAGSFVPDGTYKYRIRAQDMAGNYVYSGYYYVTKK